MKRTHLFILFIFVRCLSFSQLSDWEVGTKWVYDKTDIISDYHQIKVQKDTSILNEMCHEVLITNYHLHQYYNSLKSSVLESWDRDSSFEYLAYYPDSILWYNKSNNNFDKLYDFTLSSGDSLKVNSDVSYKILSVGDSLINGVNRKIQLIDGLMKSIIIQGIGSERDFFDPSDNYLVFPEMRRELLCFNQGDFQFKNSFCEPDTLFQIGLIDELNPLFNQWIYSKPNASGNPFYAINEYNIVGDTTVGIFKAKIISNNSGEKFIMRYTNDGISYFFKNSWRNIALYNLNIGEVRYFEIPAINPKTFKKDTIVNLICKLQSIDTLETEKGEKLKKYNFTIENTNQLSPEWVNTSNYSFIEKVGFENQFIPFLELPSVDIPTPLRCSFSESDHFQSDYWRLQNKECKYITGLGVGSAESLYKLFDNQLIIKSSSIIEIINLSGNTEIRQECNQGDVISLNNLSTGIYILKLIAENNREEKVKIYVP